MNNKKGISLITLVVTIIILLILAAISIGLIIGKDSITSKAVDSKVEARYATIIDKVKIREGEISLAESRGEEGTTAQEFVEDLIAKDILNLSEDAYEPDYSVIYIGKKEDGTYTYTINIIELEDEEVDTSEGLIVFTFQLNGGNIGGSTTNKITSGASGTPSSTPGTPNRTNYTFDGWSPSVPATFDSNKTFTAQWTLVAPTNYTFTFQLNGGSIGGSTEDRTTSGVAGSPSSTPGTPTRTHYTFDGWSPSVPSTFDGNKTFTAQWTVTTYTFTFQLNGGNIGGSIANQTTSGASGSPSSTPGTPTRTHYTFDGWSPSVPATFDGNKTFTAQWIVITYTFTFQLNEGSIGGSTNDRITSGASGTPSSTPDTPTRTNYIFDGWNPSVPNTFDGNKVFTAQWTVTTYTFTFNLNGGNRGGSTANIAISGVYGTTVDIPTDIVKTGYMFIGWTPEVPSTINGNKTFTAIWSSPMEIGMRKATTEEQVLIPITFSLGNSALISIDDGIPVEYTTINPLLTINKPIGTSINIKIAGRINQFSYYGREPIYQNQMYELIKWGELDAKSIIFYDCKNLQGTIPSPEVNSLVKITSFLRAFYNCTSLTGNIPEGLFDNCLEVTTFERTFMYCSGLIGSIPEGLFDSCTEVTSFKETFYNCGGLTGIPMGLFDNCPKVTTFYYTFYYCSSLSGSIPAGLFENCPEVTTFYYTFYYCSSLSGSIPAGLFDNCPEVTTFYGTFMYCRGLSGSIPAGLFDNCPKVTTFGRTFVGCSNLTGIPVGLFDDCPKVTTFSSTFSNCSSLIEIPASLFDNCPEVTTFHETFHGCSGLTGIPVGLFDNCPEVWDFYGTFDNCSGLTGIPADLFDNCPEVTTFTYTFSNCKGLTGISSGLFDNCPEVTTFYGTFMYCPGLTSIPADLFDNCPEVTDFRYTFSKCSNLTGIPADLFDNCPEVTSFSNTFQGCISLTGIPAGLFDNCPKVKSFSVMFYECYSLTGNIPTGLFDNCPEVTTFHYTFYRCSGLTGIPVGLFDNCSNVTTFERTFCECSSLTGSIPAGLFDNCSNVTTFSETFAFCSGLTGDAPPLWETHSGVTNHANCFTGCSGLANRQDIPQSWGGYKP